MSVLYEAIFSFELDEKDDQDVVQVLRNACSVSDDAARVIVLELLQHCRADISEVLRCGEDDGQYMHVIGQNKSEPIYNPDDRSPVEAA
jgi:hypothetical protein